MSIEDKLEALDAEQAKAALTAFVATFTSPAFGALPKREIELELFEMLRSLGVIDRKATLYGLMTDLRVTRAKASQLLFDAEVRKHGSNTEHLDKEVKDALCAARFAKDGDLFILEIENPLTQAHLRHRLKALGHVTDTSFNSAIVKMPIDAVKDLLVELIPEQDRPAVRQALIAAGLPDDSLPGILKSALKSLGGKVLGEAGDQIATWAVEAAPGLIGSVVNASTQAITEQWQGFVAQNAPAVP